MNQLKAMRETIALMDAGLLRIDENGDSCEDTRRIADLSVDLQPPHLREMLAIMESGVNPQDAERGFGEAKMGRWLGWAQAAVVAMGLASLDDMKAINKRHAG